MSTDQAKVLETLKKYRSHLAKQMLDNVTLDVQYVLSLSPDDDWGTEEEVNDARMEWLQERLSCHDLEKEGIWSPGEVLVQWDKITRLVPVDGTVRKDPTTRPSVEAYVAVTEKALREKSHGDVRDTIAFPPEFRGLAEQVDGLIGPGMPMFSYSQVPAWSMPLSGESALTPEELEEETALNSWKPWGWALGGGWNCTEGLANTRIAFCVVYCRRPGEDAWKWRYVWNEREMGMEVFESLSEFLEWYTHFREEGMEESAAEGRTRNIF